jgi:hypothetical protein
MMPWLLVLWTAANQPSCEDFIMQEYHRFEYARVWRIRGECSGQISQQVNTELHRRLGISMLLLAASGRAFPGTA